MAIALTVIVLAYCTNVMAVIPSYPAYLYPEHRTDIRPMSDEKISTNSYDLQIIPSDKYPVAEYDSSLETSLIKIIIYPVTAIATVASKVLSVGKWIVVNGVMVFFGMALVIGFCVFTPFCSLVIEKPFSRELRNLNIPYLDDIEQYVNIAYNKYLSMQNYF